MHVDTVPTPGNMRQITQIGDILSDLKDLDYEVGIGDLKSQVSNETHLTSRIQRGR